MLVGDQIGSADPPVSTAPVERDPTIFDPADKRRSRHPEQRGFLAGGQQLIVLSRGPIGSLQRRSAKTASMTADAADDDLT